MPGRRERRSATSSRHILSRRGYACSVGHASNCNMAPATQARALATSANVCIE
jgi:hypothetical protein